MSRGGSRRTACAAAILAICALGAPAAASARWPFAAPVPITPHGVVSNGWIGAGGTFHTVGRLHGAPHLTTVSPAGAVSRPRISDDATASVPLAHGRTLSVTGGRPVRLTVLSATGRRLRSAAVPGFLAADLSFTPRSLTATADGGAVVCTDVGGLRGEQLALVAPGGSAITQVPVRGPVGPPSLPAPIGGCYGVDASPVSPQTVAIVENGDATQGSGAVDAQVALIRIGPGERVATPVPVVPPGEQFTVNDGMPAVAVTASGWAVVSWLRSTQTGGGLLTRADVRWVSPDGGLGPVAQLTRPTASFPAAVSLAADGPSSAVALINPMQGDVKIDSTQLTAPGRAGPRRRLFTGRRIVPPVLATNGRRVLATWLADQTVHAAIHGPRGWTRPQRIRRCERVNTRLICPNRPGAAVARNGRAAVWYSLFTTPRFLLGGAVAFGR